MERMRKRLLTASKISKVEDAPRPVVRAPPMPQPSTSSSTSARLELSSLLVAGNFKPIKRISANSPQLLATIHEYEKKGIPLVIEGWHERPTWSKDIFNVDFLLHEFKDSPITVRDVANRVDVQIPFNTFISQSRSSRLDEGSGPLYGKDAHCPREWVEWLLSSNTLPDSVRPGATNDTLQFLGNNESVETLMCYLGSDGTFTPCHKDICASTGHNIMCYTENGGSSFWFMTASVDAPIVGKYFQESLKKELDWEVHFADVGEFARAPFPVYITEQKLGDFILVPPRSCHQVINQGGLTIKTAWSRMTVEGLRIALHHELPVYQRVCRPEQYRIKNTIYRSLLWFTKQVRMQPMPSRSNLKSRDDLIANLLTLVQIFDFVLAHEFTPSHASLPHVLGPGTPSNQASTATSSHCLQPTLNRRHHSESHTYIDQFMCDFCGADIFQSLFECRKCVRPNKEGKLRIGDGVLICPSCYVTGRTCRCGHMQAAQVRPFEVLLRARQSGWDTVWPALEKKPEKLKLMNFEEVFEREFAPTFYAAFQLLQYRNSNDETKVQTCRYEGKVHQIPYTTALECQICAEEGPYCFEDILLNFKIHSAEALAVKFKEQKDGDSELHNRHLRTSSTSKARRGFLKFELDNQQSGIEPVHHYQLTHIVRQFKSCKPTNPEFTKPGWYDKSTTIETDEVIEIETDGPKSDTDGDHEVESDDTKEEEGSGDDYKPAGDRRSRSTVKQERERRKDSDHRPRKRPRLEPKKARNRMGAYEGYRPSQTAAAPPSISIQTAPTQAADMSPTRRSSLASLANSSSPSSTLPKTRASTSQYVFDGVELPRSTPSGTRRSSAVASSSSQTMQPTSVKPTSMNRRSSISSVKSISGGGSSAIADAMNAAHKKQSMSNAYTNILSTPSTTLRRRNESPSPRRVTRARSSSRGGAQQTSKRRRLSENPASIGFNGTYHDIVVPVHTSPEPCDLPPTQPLPPTSKATIPKPKRPAPPGIPQYELDIHSSEPSISRQSGNSLSGPSTTRGNPRKANNQSASHEPTSVPPSPSVSHSAPCVVSSPLDARIMPPPPPPARNPDMVSLKAIMDSYVALENSQKEIASIQDQNSRQLERRLDEHDAHFVPREEHEAALKSIEELKAQVQELSQEKTLARKLENDLTQLRSEMESRLDTRKTRIQKYSKAPNDQDNSPANSTMSSEQATKLFTDLFEKHKEAMQLQLLTGNNSSRTDEITAQKVDEHIKAKLNDSQLASILVPIINGAIAQQQQHHAPPYRGNTFPRFYNNNYFRQPNFAHRGFNPRRHYITNYTKQQQDRDSNLNMHDNPNDGHFLQRNFDTRQKGPFEPNTQNGLHPGDGGGNGDGGSYPPFYHPASFQNPSNFRDYSYRNNNRSRFNQPDSPNRQRRRSGGHDSQFHDDDEQDRRSSGSSSHTQGNDEVNQEQGHKRRESVNGPMGHDHGHGRGRTQTPLFARDDLSRRDERSVSPANWEDSYDHDAVPPEVSTSTRNTPASDSDHTAVDKGVGEEGARSPRTLPGS